MEADIPTVRVGATPTRLTAPPPLQPAKVFFTGRMPFLPPNQQCQSTDESSTNSNNNVLTRGQSNLTKTLSDASIE